MKKLKIPYLNLLPVLVIAFFLFKLVDNTELSFGSILAVLYGCVAYFIAGFFVAYLLNPAMKFFEKLIHSEKDSKTVQKTKRAGVIAFLYLLFAGIITIFVVAIIPTVRDGVNEIVENIPGYAEYIQHFLIDFSDSLDPQVYTAIEAWVEDGFRVLYNWLSGMDYSAIGTGVSNFATGVVRMFFGFIISVYFLFSKEELISGIKKLLFALFGREKAEKIVETGRQTNEIFLNFIVSRLLQSLIIFIIGLLVLVPLRIPLAPLVALVIGATNMIPYLGPWLGGAVCVLLVLFYSPIKALWVLLYILGVQVLDNAIIGPKVMSDQVGISPLLVILGVTLGATFGGIFGMFVGVPIVAVLKLVFYDPYISRKLGGENIDF